MGIERVRVDQRPLYLQAQEQLIARISDGTYEAGQQLPPEDGLAAILGVSRTTIRTALGGLETMGYIRRVHGAGTFVRVRPVLLDIQLQTLESFHPRLAERMGVSSRLSALQIQECPSSQLIAERLCVPAGAPVIAISRVVEFDGVRVAYLRDYLPCCLVQTTQLRAGLFSSIVDYCDGREGRPLITRSDSELSLTSSDEELSGILAVPIGATLFCLDETFYREDGRVISWSPNCIVPEHSRFRISRRVLHRDMETQHDH